MPHITYIGQTPAEGTGSPVILLRHLQRFSQSGWDVSIIAEHGQDVSYCIRAGWTVHALPLRRAWWPPYRREWPWSRTLRTRLLAMECRRLMGGRRPDALLSYLAAHSDFYSEIAAHLARQSGVPLTLLIHDDATAFGNDTSERATQQNRLGWILRQAHRACFVSPELAKAYKTPAATSYVLPPIPEGWTQETRWHGGIDDPPHVYYAGSIWPAQFELLGRISNFLDAAGARLVLLTRETSELRNFLAHFPADHVSPFPSNREALKHLSQSAAGILVSYAESVSSMPWISTSFPSKLIEFLHLGIPCAVVAPAESSVGKWASRHNYPDFFSPVHLSRLAEWAQELRDPTKWQSRSNHARKLASDEFCPEKIHTLLESQLLRA